MKDFRGTELNPGDKVAVALCGGSYATYMQEYTVIGPCKRGGYNCIKLVNENEKWKWSREIVKAEHKIVKI